ncbi:flavin reductase [Virgisporangium aliadipatigenens]|uniref:Flavin reductase n=1 Tax=Virgisporangium aliadipatigenens TaxID=741659 RepID=A0A8J4DQ67_9ACTN|nr:NAD(P)-binding oxidoreductase [Virgisporangium aliadipatigenens]GIJ46720.1 flavin reductase [Virgisporangium aliadipatigenens]
MRIAVLGATGATGQLLVTTALERGLDVVALVRDPARVTGVEAAAVDVHDPDSIARAVKDCDVLLSGLGGGPGTLTAGARAAVASGVPRIIWLGAVGTGQSARAGGIVTRALMKTAMRKELPDKENADSTIIAFGGTVFHAGMLGNGPVAPARRTLTLAEAPSRMFPASVSRATVAAAMVDEAVRPRFPGMVVLPVQR